MSDEVFQMDEAKQEHWKNYGVSTNVGQWYFRFGKKLYGHFESQREAEINRDAILRRAEGCVGGTCE